MLIFTNVVFLYVAYAYLSFMIIKLLLWIYKLAIRKRKNHNSIYGNETWVLITGASEGIGKTFGEVFAGMGFNIIIVSRDIKKLKKCEESLKHINNKTQIISIPFDFSKNVTLQDYEKAFGEILSNKDISVLINNVGLRDVRKFTEFSLEEVYNMSVVNTFPQVILSKHLIEKFLKREKKSAIINISSSSSKYPLPQFVLYSSTKIFNDFFSKALSYELQDKIDIISATPFFVNSSTVKLSPNGFTIISSLQFVNSILDQLGYENTSYGYWSHQALGVLYENIVEYILLFVEYQLKKRKRHTQNNKLD